MTSNNNNHQSQIQFQPYPSESRTKSKKMKMTVTETDEASDPSQFQKGIGGPSKKNGGAAADNLLLAGYLANEFLTRGTLLGRVLVPHPDHPRNLRAGDRLVQVIDDPESSEAADNYRAVSGLLKRDDVHIPGVINPKQLVSWLNMK